MDHSVPFSFRGLGVPEDLDRHRLALRCVDHPSHPRRPGATCWGFVGALLLTALAIGVNAPRAGLGSVVLGLLAVWSLDRLARWFSADIHHTLPLRVDARGVEAFGRWTPWTRVAEVMLADGDLTLRLEDGTALVFPRLQLSREADGRWLLDHLGGLAAGAGDDEHRHALRREALELAARAGRPGGREAERS